MKDKEVIMRRKVQGKEDSKESQMEKGRMRKGGREGRGVLQVTMFGLSSRRWEQRPRPPASRLGNGRRPAASVVSAVSCVSVRKKQGGVDGDVDE